MWYCNSSKTEQRVDRGEREVETQSAGDLDEQQSDMERSDAQLAERQFAVGNQQHQEKCWAAASRRWRPTAC